MFRLPPQLLVFFMVHFLNLLHCMHSSTDGDALLCLKSQLSDPTGALDSWSNSSLTFCTWHGVTCSGENATRVASLDLESLNLAGQIFPCIRELSFLTRIHMPNNQLNGHITQDIGRLTRLRYLNLSMNSFGGTIPDTISSCSRLEVISLERNSLEACLGFILLKKRGATKLPMTHSFKRSNILSYNDLFKATDGFSSASVVGSGRFGLVYKGQLGYEIVAIKVFKLDLFGASKSFFTECEALRNIRHRNLIRVISLCSTSDPRGNEFKALILEYKELGDLESWLHQRVLSLRSRITIAMDIAAALNYLHNQCNPPLVHCDLKPRNVLLDGDMVASLGDFGLAKFLHGDSSTGVNMSASIAGPRGSVGYIAPEYGTGCKISTAGDVYSYGIILLQMITGKQPTDDMFKDGMNLHRCVEEALTQDFGAILEPSLSIYDEGAENIATVKTKWLVKQLAKLGLKCSETSPKDRPTMRDVYNEIITIEEMFSSLHHQRKEINDLVNHM